MPLCTAELFADADGKGITTNHYNEGQRGHEYIFGAR